MPWKTKHLSAVTGMSVVGWDLDSSVRSTMQRRWLVPAIRRGDASWHDYSMLCEHDEPNPGAVALMRMLSVDYLNIAISGSSAGAEDMTVDWARRHNVPLDDFLLRPDGDAIPVSAWKVECVRRLRAAGLEVVLFVEDWAPDAAAIRAEGIPVLGVNPFDSDAMLMNPADLGMTLAELQGTDEESGRKLADGAFDSLRGKLRL
jgi:hypothetical protein